MKFEINLLKEGAYIRVYDACALQPLRILAILFLKRIAVPYLAPAIIEPTANRKIWISVGMGRVTDIGSSTMMWKIAMDSTDTVIPHT